MKGTHADITVDDIKTAFGVTGHHGITIAVPHTLDLTGADRAT